MSEVAQENSIYVSAKAKQKVMQLMQDAGVVGDANYFYALVWWVVVVPD